MGSCAFLVENCAFGVEKCALLATSLVGLTPSVTVFLEYAERSRWAPGSNVWYHGTSRFNDYPPSGAVRDEVVELKPSFEHLPPVLKPCFPVALRDVLIYDLGGGTLGASLWTTGDGLFEVTATTGDAHLGTEDFHNQSVDVRMQDSKRKNRGKDLSWKSSCQSPFSNSV